jgi:hypothetical protein
MVYELSNALVSAAGSRAGPTSHPLTHCVTQLTRKLDSSRPMLNQTGSGKPGPCAAVSSCSSPQQAPQRPTTHKQRPCSSMVTVYELGSAAESAPGHAVPSHPSIHHLPHTPHQASSKPSPALPGVCAPPGSHSSPLQTPARHTTHTQRPCSSKTMVYEFWGAAGSAAGHRAPSHPSSSICASDLHQAPGIQPT